MAEFHFFYPNGVESTSKEDFIDFYSRLYYYENRNLDLENAVEEALADSELSAEDIVNIMCWKTGGKCINEDDKIKVKSRYITIDTTPIVKRIEGNKKKVLNELEENPLNELTEISGIGNVYGITLLYFLSCGDYPIYDIYAHLALIAIDTPDFKFNSTIKDPPEITWQKYQEEYLDGLKRNFGNDGYKDRKVDQALWTYGHLFRDNDKNKHRNVCDLQIGVETKRSKI